MGIGNLPVLLIQVSGTAIGGAALVVVGLRPRRLGGMPHCGMCDYNLTGLSSDRCPECGAAVVPEGIVYGERRRRPAVALFGVFSLAFAAVMAATSLSRVDWYRLYPTAIVMTQMRSADAYVAARAWKEVDRRMRANTLSDRQGAWLIELALTEQGAAQASPVRQEILDYLDGCISGRRLSQEQEKKFFDQMFGLFGLKVRPRIAAGDLVPFRVDIPSCRRSKSLWWQVNIREQVDLDGQPMPLRGDQSYSNPTILGNYSALLSIECETVGQHKLGARPQVVIYSGPRGNTQASAVVHKRQVAMEAMFEVVAEPPGRIDPVKNASLRSQLRALIVPRDFEWQGELSSRGGVTYELSGQIEVRPLPVDVAFDVIARLDGREYRMGGVAMTRGKGATWHVGSGDAALAQASSDVDIILRSNEKRARQTVDVFEIWEGELGFENISVKGMPTSSSCLR